MFYNVKVLHYQDGLTETRIYSHGVKIGTKKSPKIIDSESVKSPENQERTLAISVKRTVNKIYEITHANKWAWFVTLTLDGKKVNRYDYSECVKAVSEWLYNFKRTASDLVYIVVPERHKDGAFHFHALFSNSPFLRMSFSGHFTKAGEPIYNVENYKLGWTTATEVENNEAVAKYITKYITKDLCSSTKGKKRYWASRNALRPVEQKLCMNPADKGILREELENDNDYYKQVFYEVGTSVRSVSYFRNQGLTLSFLDEEGLSD